MYFHKILIIHLMRNKALSCMPIIFTTEEAILVYVFGALKVVNYAIDCDSRLKCIFIFLIDNV